MALQRSAVQPPSTSIPVPSNRHGAWIVALGPGRDGGRGVPGPLDTAGFRGSADAARQSQGGQAGWDFGFRDALFALFLGLKKLHKVTTSHNMSQQVTKMDSSRI